MIGSGLGSVPLGSLWRRRGATAPPATGLQIYIGGTDVTRYFRGLDWTESLGARGEARIQFVDDTGNFHVEYGQTVRILQDGVPRFGGLVAGVEEQVPDATIAIFLDVTAADHSALFDRHIVNKAYGQGPGEIDDPAAWVTVKDIVVDIILFASGSIGETLYDAGVRYAPGSLQDGPTIKRVVFSDVKASEAMDRLGELAGFSWWLDPNKILYFQDSSSVRGPAPIESSAPSAIRDTRHGISGDNYRNIQLLKGGRRATDVSRSQTFLGDGQQTTWTLNLPIAAKPTITVGGVPVDPDDIAIKEQDEEALWLYEVGEPTITQQTSDEHPEVAAGVEIKVTYRGYYPIKVRARDEVQIRARKAVEGGTGVYHDIESDDRIDDFKLAIRRARGLLARHARITESLRLTTYTPGYHAGQLVRVAMGEYRILADYLVESVRATCLAPIEPAPMEYELSLVNNIQPGGWAQWFRDLARVHPVHEGENETIHEHLAFQDKIVVTDALTIQDGDQRPALVDRYLTHYVIGRSSIGRRRRDAAGAEEAGYMGGPVIGLEVAAT